MRVPRTRINMLGFILAPHMYGNHHGVEVPKTELQASTIMQFRASSS